MTSSGSVFHAPAVTSRELGGARRERPAAHRLATDRRGRDLDILALAALDRRYADAVGSPVVALEARHSRCVAARRRAERHSSELRADQPAPDPASAIGGMFGIQLHAVRGSGVLDQKPAALGPDDVELHAG